MKKLSKRQKEKKTTGQQDNWATGQLENRTKGQLDKGTNTFTSTIPFKNSREGEEIEQKIARERVGGEQEEIEQRISREREDKYRSIRYH